MENKLSKLFEFQRFENNKQLDKIIKTVQNELETAHEYLDETALAFVAGGKKDEAEFKEKKEERI